MVVRFCGDGCDVAPVEDVEALLVVALVSDGSDTGCSVALSKSVCARGCFEERLVVVVVVVVVGVVVISLFVSVGVVGYVCGCLLSLSVGCIYGKSERFYKMSINVFVFSNRNCNE